MACSRCSGSLATTIPPAPGPVWARRPERTLVAPARLAGWAAGRALLRQEPPRGKLQRFCVAARSVIGGHEVEADHQREGKDAAGLDLILVAADRSEQQ